MSMSRNAGSSTSEKSASPALTTTVQRVATPNPERASSDTPGSIEAITISRPDYRMTNAEIIECHKKDIPVPMVEFTVVRLS